MHKCEVATSGTGTKERSIDVKKVTMNFTLLGRLL